MNIRILSAGAVAVLALAITGCKSVQLDITPNPVVVGLLDTKATIHAHVVAKGYGSVPFNSVQFAVFDEKNAQLASSTEKIDASGQTMVMDRDYTVPINGAAVALSGTKYIMVRIRDPQGNLLAERKLDVVFHALNGLSLPGIFGPKDTTQTPAPTPTPAPSPSP